MYCANVIKITDVIYNEGFIVPMFVTFALLDIRIIIHVFCAYSFSDILNQVMTTCNKLCTCLMFCNNE